MNLLEKLRTWWADQVDLSSWRFHGLLTLAGAATGYWWGRLYFWLGELLVMAYGYGVGGVYTAGFAFSSFYVLRELGQLSRGEEEEVDMGLLLDAVAAVVAWAVATGGAILLTELL